jgi:hypothetical protein
MWGHSLVAKRLAASQEGLCSVELVSYIVSQLQNRRHNLDTKQLLNAGQILKYLGTTSRIRMCTHEEIISRSN